MNAQKDTGGTVKGCLQILLGLAVLGYFVEQCEMSSCDICGDYSFEHFEESSAFSDQDIADMIGTDRVEEYKQRLNDQPSLTYALTIDRPEELETDQIKAEIVIGIRSPDHGDVIYKGKIVTTTGDTVADGIIRIEYRYNGFHEEFQQITFGNDQNILFYILHDDGLIIRNGNSEEYGLSILENELFKRD